MFNRSLFTIGLQLVFYVRPSIISASIVQMLKCQYENKGACIGNRSVVQYTV